MSLTLDAFMSRQKTALDTLQQAERVLRGALPSPFQIFARTFGGRSLALNDIEVDTSIARIKAQIVDKEGIPADQFYLVYQGAVLEESKTVAFYGISREATLHMQGRLIGGIGEKAAVQYALDTKMKRGNVDKDVLATEGASFALKNFGRSLKRDEAFRDKIRAKLNLRVEDGTPDKVWKAWWRKNRNHVEALIQETTLGGNCGDFASVVASRLSAEHDGQWVYQIVMEGTCTGKTCPWNLELAQLPASDSRSLRGTDPSSWEGHTFDHQLCITYPQGSRSDAAMKAMTLDALDDDLAMVADGWDDYRVCSFKKFKAGRNCYHVVTNAPLRITSAHKGEKGSGLGKTAKLNLRELIRDEIKEFTGEESGAPSDRFVFDKARSVLAACRDDSYRQGYLWAAFCFERLGGIDPATSLKALSDHYEAQVAKKQGYFTDRLRDYAALKDPDLSGKQAAFKGDVRQSLVKSRFKADAAAACVALFDVGDWRQCQLALMGMVDDDYWEYFLLKSDLPSFDISTTGVVRDQRESDDVSQQLAQIALQGSWSEFAHEALQLKPAELMEYFLATPSNRDRCLHEDTVQSVIFDQMQGLSGGPLVASVNHLAPDQFGAFLNHGAAARDAVNSNATTLAVLHRFLTLCPKDGDVKKLAARLDDDALVAWAESGEDAMARLASVPSLRLRWQNKVLGSSPQELEDEALHDLLDGLGAPQRLAVVAGNPTLRDKIFGTPRLRAALFTWNLHRDAQVARTALTAYGDKLKPRQLEAIALHHPELTASVPEVREALYAIMLKREDVLEAVYRAFSPADRKQFSRDTKRRGRLRSHQKYPDDLDQLPVGP